MPAEFSGVNRDGFYLEPRFVRSEKVATTMLAKAMKSFLLALVVALGSGGLARADDFEDFRAKVQERLLPGWSCGPIRTFEGQKRFDVKARGNPFILTVWRQDFLSQEEWNEVVRQAHRLIREDFGGKGAAGLEEKDAQVLKRCARLPQGRYGGMAIFVSCNAPEDAAPDGERREGHRDRVSFDILGLLDPYNLDVLDALRASER